MEEAGSWRKSRILFALSHAKFACKWKNIVLRCTIKNARPVGSGTVIRKLLLAIRKQ